MNRSYWSNRRNWADRAAAFLPRELEQRSYIHYRRRGLHERIELYQLVEW